MNLSLPASLFKTEREEQRKIQLFAPLSDTERGWGRGQIRLVELTLNVMFFGVGVAVGDRFAKLYQDVPN
jgi:hypothetical protein